MSNPQNPWHRMLQLRGKIKGVFARQKQKMKERNKRYRRKMKKYFKEKE